MASQLCKYDFEKIFFAKLLKKILRVMFVKCFGFIDIITLIVIAKRLVLDFHTGRCRSFRSYKYIPFTHYQSLRNSYNTYTLDSFFLIVPLQLIMLILSISNISETRLFG